MKNHYSIISLNRWISWIKNEITEQKAVAISKLASQATRLYELEQKRAIIQIQLQQMGYSDIEIRELSSKGFDDTTKKLIDSTEY